jgi:hypothetical protein
MKHLLHLLLITALQGVTHFALNWWIALCIPIAFIAWKARGYSSAWWWAVASTVLSWCGLFALNFIMAGEAVSRMIPMLAGLMRAPAFVLPLVSVAFAAWVGLLAGLVGIGLRGLMMSNGAASSKV